MSQELIRVYTACSPAVFSVAQGSDPFLQEAAMTAHALAMAEALKAIPTTKGL